VSNVASLQRKQILVYVRFFPTRFCRGGDQNNSSVQKYFLYLRNVHTDEINGETNMMDECLESGILLYTLNFATARPIAFTSLHRHVTCPHYTTVRQLLLSSSRRAAQSASSLFFSYRSVYRCPTGGTARPDSIQ